MLALRITSATLVFLLAACAADPPIEREWTPEDHGHPKSADPSRSPAAQAPAPAAESPEQAQARAARALFNVSCATCHGRDGRGGGPARPPGAQMPNLADAALLAKRSDAELTQVIAEGRGLMPGFADKIRPEGIQVLVRYVRALAPVAQPSSGAAPPAP